MAKKLWQLGANDDVAQPSDFADKADASALRYKFVSPTASGGAWQCQDRAINAISVAETDATVTLAAPVAVQGRARDFIAVLTVAARASAPDLVFSGFVAANADGTSPDVAFDASSATKTLLLFTEVASGLFLVKGEALVEVSQ